MQIRFTADIDVTRCTIYSSPRDVDKLAPNEFQIYTSTQIEKDE